MDSVKIPHNFKRGRGSFVRPLKPMATYQQYSEVVAAYGHTLPPPEQPEISRVGVALLYAAIGVALGTMTGTGMAVVSTQPGGFTGFAHRLTLPSFGTAKIAHPSAPVVAHTTATSAPAAAQSAPAQSAAATTPATVQSTITAPAPVVAATVTASPATHTSLISRVLASSTVEASVDTRALHTISTSRSSAANPQLATAPAVHRQGAVLHTTTAARKPAVKLAALGTSSALPVPAVVPVSLDEQVTPAIFYSEGDTTVVDYDSALGTILTNDGRTFEIGPTVAVSTATSWNDYRSNVHYRCDQGGKCTITRSGVIALNAKQI